MFDAQRRNIAEGTVQRPFNGRAPRVIGTVVIAALLCSTGQVLDPSPAGAAEDEPNGVAIGLAKGAAAACSGVQLTQAAIELEQDWLKRAKDRRFFELGRDTVISEFRCLEPLYGIGCRERNLSRCGKAIQGVGPQGWLRPGLINVGKDSPYSVDMPPPPPLKESVAQEIERSAWQPEQETPEDSLLLDSIHAMLEKPGDSTHGLALLLGKPYNEITVHFTVYGAATPSELIKAAADAAIKIADLVTARKLDFRGRRLRIRMAIEPRPRGDFINTFVVAWTADELAAAAKHKDGRTTLTRTGTIEEIFGSYWPVLCSNLPPPELFTWGGEVPEHPLDVENPANRDLGCRRRAGSEIRIGAGR
jgi:hypothetical protein